MDATDVREQKQSTELASGERTKRRTMTSMLRRSVVVAGLVAIMIATTGVAFAGSGVGGIFNLGVKNTVNALSSLVGSSASGMLQVTNTNTGSSTFAIGAKSAGGPAASFNAPAGQPPIAVDSTTEVPNLNAQFLDGLTSSAFYANGSTVANSNLLDGLSSSAFYANGSTVANSNALDGLSASAFGDRWFAVVAPDGSLIAGNGVSSTQHYGAGQYAVRFTGNIANASQCAGIATLEDRGPGWINVVPSANSSDPFGNE